MARRHKSKPPPRPRTFRERFRAFFADKPQVDRAALESEAIERSAPMLAGFDPRFRSMLASAPEAWNLSIRAKQSNSAAHGFVYLRDPWLYDIYDEMVDKDPAIYSCESYIVARVLALEMRVEPADDSDRAKEIADACEADLIRGVKGEFGFGAMIENLLRGAIRSGLSPVETIWRYNDADKRFAAARYMHRHPGQFGFGADGQPYLWRAFGQKEKPEQDDLFDPLAFKFTIAKMPSLYGSPYGHSMLHGLRWHWAFKQELTKQYLNALDKHGTPMAVAKITSAAGNDLEDRLDKLNTLLESLTASTGAAMRPDEELSFIPRGLTGGGLPHEAAIQWIDSMIMRVMLGSTLHVAEAQFGTRAQADVHMTVSDQHVIPIAKIVEDAINTGLIASWYRINFADADMMPRVVFDTDREIEVAQAIEIIRQARESGVAVTVAQFREWFGIEAPEEKDAVIENVQNEIYQYHLTYGISTVNEARARLGLAPIAGGDVPVDPAVIARASGGDPNAPIEFADRNPSVKKNFNRLSQDRDGRARPKALLASVRRNEKIAAAAAETARQSALRTLEAVRSAVGLFATDRTLTLDATVKNYAKPNTIIPEADVARILYAGRALALYDMDRRIVAERLDFADDEIETAGHYEEAIEWLVEKKAITEAQRGAIVKAIRKLDPYYDAAITRETIGRQARAITAELAASVNDEISSVLSDAVLRGDTLVDFITAMDGLIETGKLPGRSEAYFENVFRTETASAYGAMTRDKLADPEVQDFVWGVEIYNPDDDRSRESHAAVNGLLLKKGSEAYNSLPNAPFSYQCRCVVSPIMLGDPSASDLEEPGNALSLVLAIEGF